MNAKKQRRYQVIQQQVNRLKRRLTALYQLSNRYTQIRLGLFLLGFGLTAGLFYLQAWTWGTVSLVLSSLAFGGAVYVHQRIEASLLEHQVWLELKATHLARMRLDWDALPSTTTASPPADHPFGNDFDLTGSCSLHHLLDTTVSQEASALLKTWLLETAPDFAQIQDRQMLVQALVPLSTFRDQLTLKARLASTGMVTHWQGQGVLPWLNEASTASDLWPLALGLGSLSLINLLLFGLYWLAILPPLWVASLILYVGLTYLRWPAVTGVFHLALTLRNGLEPLQAVFTYLEQSSHTKHTPLAKRCQAFLDSQNRPSSKLRQVNLIAGAAGFASTPILGIVLNLVGPWNLYLAHRLNQFQGELKRFLPQWLEAWFELEALSALATFSYLNPDYVFPTLIPTAQNNPAAVGGTILFKAQNLGHPLIQAEQKISNDFAVPRLGNLGLITGSNMSGKSTFMRAVGINLSLAYAGGPVDAVAMQTRIFRLFSCLKVSDSVTDGFSYFYAEVRRLKALLDTLEQATEEQPLLFFIDEIFRGTNNRERLLGSQSFIRAVVGQQGYGLIATHDLALVRLADEIGHIQPYHFRDQVVDGQMVFDYLLRPGPCPTTNALAIMRLAGLPVDERDGYEK